MFLINHIACIWRRLISANVFHSPWCQELVVSLSSSASPLNMTLNFPAVYYWFMVWSNRPSTSETFIAFVHSVPPVSVMYVCHRHRPFSDDDVSWQSVVVRLWLQSLSINSLNVRRGGWTDESPNIFTIQLRIHINLLIPFTNSFCPCLAKPSSELVQW